MTTPSNSSMTPNNVHVELRPGMRLKKRTYGRTEEWWLEEETSPAWAWLFLIALVIAGYFYVTSQGFGSKKVDATKVESTIQTPH